MRRFCLVEEWLAWHKAYDDPSSSLTRRLQVVRRRLDEALNTAVGTRRQLVSLCAGDGRDVISVLHDRQDSSSISAVLVERDDELAQRAVDAAMLAGLGNVSVRCADAGDVTSFEDVLPADVLLLCGIFGNVDHRQVQNIVEKVPRLLALSGYVIWTRGASDPDRRQEIRSWFVEAGLAEVSFDGAPEAFGVGVNQRGTRPSSSPPQRGDRLFSFAED